MHYVLQECFAALSQTLQFLRGNDLLMGGVLHYVEISGRHRWSFQKEQWRMKLTHMQWELR